MLHVGEYFATRKEEYVGITVLVVKLREGTVEMALARQGEGIAMHESLSLLSVALGGEGIDAVGDWSHRMLPLRSCSCRSRTS